MAESLHGEVFGILRASTGLDFSGYKPSTIERRLQRRMLLSRTPTLEAYVARLHTDARELEALRKDLLVGVTYFFRDPDTFEFLRTGVFPALLAAAAERGGPRIWVAGCASGKEAYSLAVALMEAAGGPLPAGARVLASDISPHYVDAAVIGAYPREAADEMGPERLERFFTQEAGGYSVGAEVRAACEFVCHDMTSGPLQTGLDFISCRNVMIYFDSARQRAVFEVFHRALRPEGLLLLGRAESVLAAGRLFEPVDKGHRLYRKVEQAS